MRLGNGASILNRSAQIYYNFFKKEIKAGTEREREREREFFPNEASIKMKVGIS